MTANPIAEALLASLLPDGANNADGRLATRLLTASKRITRDDVLITSVSRFVIELSTCAEQNNPDAHVDVIQDMHRWYQICERAAPDFTKRMTSFDDALGAATTRWGIDAVADWFAATNHPVVKPSFGHDDITLTDDQEDVHHE